MRRQFSITFLTFAAILFFLSNIETSALPQINFKLNLNFPKIEKIDKTLKFYEFIEARRGGGFGFGRSRGSFGRSRSSSRSSATRSRSTTAPRLRSNPAKSPSFGGSRISRQQATAKYGAPRRTQSIPSKNQLGQPMNYRVNDYGGFSSSLMMGYMMGNMAWWMTAPAFFYSRPVYAENADGTVDVYPPTFNFGKLLMTIIIIAIIVMFVRSSLRSRKTIRSDNRSGGSFV